MRRSRITSTRRARRCLAPHFADRSPEYPIFSVLVTRQNRDQAAQEALRWIAGGVKSKQGTAILDALELLDGETLKPRNSRYAKHVLDALSQKGQGQVLNRSELVASEAGVDYWTKFRIEPEFLSVVLAALVHSGDIVLSLAGKKVDAAGIDQFAKVGIAEVTEFKHIDRPRDLPLGPLQDLCDLLDVPKGLIVNPANRDDGVAKIQQRAGELLGKVVAAQARIPDLIFWGRPILSEQEQKDWKDRLGSLKGFLESLQPFNTSGKLKNFPHDSAAVLGQKPAIDLSREVDELGTVLQQTNPLTSYLGKAEALLDASHPWQDAVRTARADLMAKIASPKQRSEADFKRLLTQTLGDLKTKYQDAYLAAHERARLGANDDKRKANLAKDSRLAQIQKIANVEMMPTPQLRDFENKLFALKTCFQLGRPDLDSDPLCPHCGFRPAEEPAGGAAAKKTLADLDETLDAIVRGWTDTLRTNLEDPTVSGNIELVSDPVGKRELQGFLKSKTAARSRQPGFREGAAGGSERPTAGDVRRRRSASRALRWWAAVHHWRSEGALRPLCRQPDQGQGRVQGPHPHQARLTGMAQKRKSRGGDGDLFIEGAGQLRLVDKSAEQQALEKGKVECLGMTFDSEDARRAYFTDRLREKLADPEFRKTPGFPKGTDEDIVRMSDAPWYTACPNPFLADFVRVYGKPYDPKERYERDPFAVDTSVGKTDALYKAHGYHTKVPHLAIVPSILHYTEPGDIVLDGFAGSGMTGVAAQWCGSAPAEYRKQLEAEWSKQGLPKPKWGARRAILNDLGPAATFIAANYTLALRRRSFCAKRRRASLGEVEKELGWMYETLHTDGKTKGPDQLHGLERGFHLPGMRRRSELY